MEPPLQVEILRILLEAGEENLPTILNTLLVQHPATAPEMLLADVADALERIERQSYAQLARYDDSWIALTPEERQLLPPLTKSVVWHPATGRWRWNSDVAGRERPTVVLTEEGREHIRGVLRTASHRD